MDHHSEITKQNIVNEKSNYYSDGFYHRRAKVYGISFEIIAASSVLRRYRINYHINRVRCYIVFPCRKSAARRPPAFVNPTGCSEIPSAGKALNVLFLHLAASPGPARLDSLPPRRF